MKQIVRKPACPEGLFIVNDQKPAFGVDIAQDEESQAVVRDILSKLYRLDFTKVSIRGATDSPDFNLLRVVLYDHLDDVYADFEMHTFTTGFLEVRPREGCSIQQAIRRDLIGNFAQTWLQTSGKPSNWPYGIEICLNQQGGLAIDIQLCC